MTARRRLSHRRGAVALNIEHAGHRYRMQVGYFPDGAVGEVFLDATKQNSMLDAFAADAAILLSLLLQHGALPAEIGHALRRSPNGAPASLIGAVVDEALLAVGTNNMDDTFERACRDADRKAASRPEDPRILRARRLLADDVSYERAYAEFMRERPTPEATVDALVYSLRRGIAELTKPDILRRLSELDKGQLKAICRRLQNFKPEIAPPWSPEDVAALIAKWRELHG
jgi:hypothetical protein